MNTEKINSAKDFIDLDILKDFFNISSTSVLDETLIKYFKDKLEIEHLSVWGRDDSQECFYLLKELLFFDGTIKINSTSYVIDFENRHISKFLRAKQDKAFFFIKGGDHSELFETLYNVKRNLVVLFCVNVANESFYFLLVVCAMETKELHSELLNAKIICELYIDFLIKLRQNNIQDQINKIITSKFSHSGIRFVKQACEEFKNILIPSSFSLWIIEHDTITPYYFSNGHSETGYKLGEGLTGCVALNGKPIFLHSVKNAKKVYGIDWIGKTSDYGGRIPNPDDHIIIIPLSYPQKAGGERKINGVIRFVRKNTSPSFWMIDFKSAINLAEALSVLLYQDFLLSSQKETSQMHDTLINLMGNVLPMNSLEDIFLAFMGEIEKWPGLVDWTIVNIYENSNKDRIQHKFICWEDLQLLNNAGDILRDEVKLLSENIYAYPIFAKEKLDSFLVVNISNKDSHNTYEWLKTAVLIIGYIYSNGILIEETQKLRDDNEEKQLQAFTSTVYRLYAHEALNGIKAIESWIKNSKRSSPDYERLSVRTKEIHDNIVELLESTSFVKFKNKRCSFNNELEGCLNKLGFKNQKNFGNCILKLDIIGFKQRFVNIDPNILIPILNNLVLNAREQYELNGKKGPIEISMVEKSFDGQSWVGLMVKDYAVGIEECNMKLIFNSGWSTKKNGQGLGLWIIKKLVDGNDGKIELNSTYGHYTSFAIFFLISD